MAQDNKTSSFKPGQAPAAAAAPAAPAASPPTASPPTASPSSASPPTASPGDPHPTAGYPAHPEHRGGTGWPEPPDGDADRAAAAPPHGPIVVRTGGGFLRGLFFLTATAAVIVAIVLGMTAVGILPQLTNPFGARTTDRSQPALLKSIQDMQRFVAAEGNFQVIVDVQNDTRYVPDFLLNDRTLFVAAGNVQAYVDFTALGQGAISESADRRTVEIKLPAPQLNKPSIDHDKSYVFAQQRGALNRLGDVFQNDPNKLQRLYQLGEQKIADAAKSSELQQRAEDNTRRMLEGMLRSLGYTSVTIKYTAP
jgi:hypothetical protein